MHVFIWSYSGRTRHPAPRPWGQTGCCRRWWSCCTRRRCSRARTRTQPPSTPRTWSRPLHCNHIHQKPANQPTVIYLEWRFKNILLTWGIAEHNAKAEMMKIVKTFILKIKCSGSILLEGSNHKRIHFDLESKKLDNQKILSPPLFLWLLLLLWTLKPDFIF